METSWQEQSRQLEEDWKKQEAERKKRDRRRDRLFLGFMGIAIILGFSPLVFAVLDSGGPEVTAEATILSTRYAPDSAAWECEIRTPDGVTRIWMPAGFAETGTTRIRVIYNRGNYSKSPGNVRLAPPK